MLKWAASDCDSVRQGMAWCHFQNNTVTRRERLSGYCWSMQITPNIQLFLWKKTESTAAETRQVVLYGDNLKPNRSDSWNKSLQSFHVSCEHGAVFTSAKDAVCFHKTIERTACQKSAPLVLHPHCSSPRLARCIIYGFCNCLHMQQLHWNLRQNCQRWLFHSQSSRAFQRHCRECGGESWFHGRQMPTFIPF